MKLRKYIISLFALPLLVACGGSSGGGGGKGEIDFDHSVPILDVDNISVGDIHKDAIGGAIVEDSENVYFDFYEVSDYHGTVNFSTDDKTIGLSKMGDYISKKRALNPGGTVVLSSGDMFQGSAESNLTRGYLVNYGMNIMGFESMTLGNHEFDWGVEWIKKNSQLKVDDYSIPFLGANVYEKATGQMLEGLKASTIITRGDYKIGVVGTLGNGAEKSIMRSLISDLEFKDEVPIVKAEAARLKDEEHCDIVVWSSHRDVEELSKAGVTKADGVDVVFGGHTHKNTDDSTADIPYLETKNMGKGIAHAQMAINKSTKEVTCITHGVDEEPYAFAGLQDHSEVNKVFNVYNQYIDPIKNEIIGKADRKLEVSNSFTLTNLCVDTMALAAQHWADANANGMKICASYHNANGGVRADIAAGDVKFSDVYKSFPFDNEVVIVQVTGSKLKDFTMKPGNFGFWRDMDILPSKSAIDTSATYYFTTTDFWATAPASNFNLQEEDLIRTGYIVRDCVAARFEYEGTVQGKNFTSSLDKFKLPS